MRMMNKKSLLLSIGTALLWSLVVSDVGHTTQTENRQASLKPMVVELNGTANAPTAQLSNTANPCHVSGKGRTRAICGKQSLPGSGKRVADWSQYASAIFIVTLTIMLSTMIFFAAFSLALIVVAALSRRTPHQALERVDNNPSLHGHEQRASYALADTLCESDHAGWLRRAWVVGFVWFIGFLGSIWFLWIDGSFEFLIDSNQTN